MKSEYKEKYRRMGLKIAYFRKIRCMTQEELAEKANINAAFIGQVEAPNMDKAISLDTLFAIAEVLDVPAHKFLDFDDD